MRRSFCGCVKCGGNQYCSPPIRTPCFPDQSDLFQNLFDQQYDLIVTNPPYVDEEDLTDMPEEFHYEPELALGSGIDGLEITKQI